MFDHTCQQTVPNESAHFTTTRWGLVSVAGGDTSTASREALDELCRAYWYPLYAYVRRHGYSPSDAEDLTQGFLCFLCRKRAIAVADPERGRFRSFLLTALRHFLINEWDRRLIYSPESLGRFVREARIASCLDHPAICKVHEVGQAAGWGWFIAMELVPGPTLKAKLRCGPLEPNEVLGIALPVSDALQTAHAKGIVHRDIKSSNLSFGELGRVKLLDFGLAKWLALEESTLGPGTEFHTRGGSVLGSAGYMSPEQALGRTLDRRTDLFSLGVVLYEALTGRLPFGGSTFREIVHQTVHDEPEPIHRINARVPPALEQVINRCLQKDPRQRYPSAAALRDDFQNLMPAGPRPSDLDRRT